MLAAIGVGDGMGGRMVLDADGVSDFSTAWRALGLHTSLYEWPRKRSR